MTRTINEIIIHCTATRPDFMASNSPIDRVAEVRRWHMDDRGWSDIGYHYLIDRDGTVVAGRPVRRAGAHVIGHNDNSIGIALFGGHGGAETDNFYDNFTDAQLKALAQVIRELDPKRVMKVTGHNEYAAKACPTFKVASIMPFIDAPKTPEPAVEVPDEKQPHWLEALIEFIIALLSGGKK